ncbi:strawberry notch-like [Chlorella sorokiniana]|uniref:Strawberry notch-like n=1 Tax=Chlorella sorokiniana TaxID=3076 RepID=A0A2P6TVW1_CHLSO|nr:strawberry notch-like [Chlorella sorokiniana]|eukprot:PRW58205.1 strawberry notch-like [Chlorella sorokiniana]
MSAPPDGTVLQVQCGSCLKIVNVPAEYLDQLLLYKMYSCPHCKSRQQIQLTAQQETSLRIQAKQILSAAAQQQQQQQQRQQQGVAQQQQQQRQAAAAQLAAYTQALAAAATAAGTAPRPQAQAAAPTPADMLGRLVAAMQQQQQQQQQQQAAARPPRPAQPPAAVRPPAPAPRPAATATAVQMLQRQMAAMVAAAGAAAQQRLQNAALAAAANTAATQQQQQQAQQPQQQQQQQVQVPPALLEALRRAQQLQAEQARQQAAAQAAQPAAGQPAQQAAQQAQQAAELAQLAQQQQQLLELAQQQLAEQLAQQLLEPFPDELYDADDSEVRETFMAYAPAKLPFGQPHPDSVVETASLAAVAPPDITYQLAAHDQLVGCLSALQLESVVYACQRHQQMLPDGSRAGFFIGDGAGVGKGRTVAGLILENWVQGRHKHLWLSVGADLKIDTNRDLADVGAGHLPLHALNKLPYGKLAGGKIGVKDGVMFLTYSSLTSSSDRGHTRFRQLVDWCGPDFDGLIVFDESHKAKNLVPEGGTRPTQVGIKVRELQAQLPKARIVYCSATGASEPRNMAYMTRLGLWGEGNPAFKDFSAFLEAVQPKGSGGSSGSSMAALELVAMDMKAQGMFVCRTLSFAGAEFQTVEAPLEEPIASQYKAATAAWSHLFREFLQAEERAAAAGLAFDARATWRAFWAAHQAFFRHLTMAAKVPAIVRMARAALASGKCAVIGLQSTGEARTADVVAEKGEQLDDFVSGPKELLLRLVDLHFPLPPDPDAPEDEDGSDSDFDVAAVTEAAARNKLGGRDQAYRGAKARQIRYREFSESEDIGATASSSSDSDSESDGYVSGSSSGGSSGGGSGSEEDEEEEEDEEGEEGAEGGSGEDEAQRAQQEAAQQEEAQQEEAQRAKRERAEAAFQEALGRKEMLLALVQQLELPNNPLDSLIDQLGGPTQVAEMTGRKGRLVRSGEGGAGVVYEARNASGVEAGSTLEMINVHERELFLSGQKLVAIISEAASAGISLHADRRCVNQRRRLHLTLELPWSADRAIQQFGRTHRANQAHGPQYRLVFTPLGGERRFAAAVARRLESLGALTQGDRRAGPSLAAFNFDSSWGQRALRETYRAIMGEERAPPALPQACRPGPDGEPPAMSQAAFMARARALLLNVGVIRHNRGTVAASQLGDYLARPEGALASVGRIAEADMADVPRFLNRLLGLDPEAQAVLFDFYSAMLDALMERARREGTLDEGIVDIRARSVALAGEPQVLLRDAVTGAATVLHEVELDRGLPWADAQQLLEQHQAEAAAAAAGLASPPATALPAVLASVPAPQQDEAEEGQEGQEAGLKVEQQTTDGAVEQPVQEQAGAAEQQQEQQSVSEEPADGRQEQQPPADSQEQQQLQEQQSGGVPPGGSPPSGAASDGGQQQQAGSTLDAADGEAGQEDGGNGSSGRKRQRIDSPAAEGAAAADGKAEQRAEASPRQEQQRSHKRTAAAAAAEGSGSGSELDDEVVEVTEEELRKQGGNPAARRHWVSGFYRAKASGINRQVHVLLVLEVPGSEPPAFVVHRPATGRSRQTLSLQELRSRYRPLEPAECQPLWEKAFEAADATDPKERPGAVARKRRMHILGGAVMRCWGAVQDVLARHASESERRVRVVRIATTGEQPQRLVGMLIPEPAVEEVVAALRSRSGDGSGSGGNAAGAEQAPAAGSGQGSQQEEEGAEGGKEGAAKGSPAKGATRRAAKAEGEVGSPKAGGHSGRRHHRRRHRHAAAEADGGSGEDLPSPKRRRHGHKAAKPAQGEASDCSGGSEEELPSPKRRRRQGHKAAKPAQGEASDRSGGSAWLQPGWQSTARSLLNCPSPACCMAEIEQQQLLRGDPAMAPKRKGDGGNKSSKKAKGSPQEEAAAPERQSGGKLYFLLKRRADLLTAQQIEDAEGHTVTVTGLCNVQANRPVLEAMQEGDEVLFFQSPPKGGKERDFAPSITALVSVARAPYPDPEDDKGRGWLAVDLKMENVFEDPVTLSALKEHKSGELAGWSLFAAGSNLQSLHYVPQKAFDFIMDEM